MKKTKLGGTLRLGPHDVTVKCVPTSVLSDNESVDGELDSDKLEIKLSNSMAPSRVVEVLCHELCHFWLMGAPMSEELEEFVAIMVGNGMVSFLRDNPVWVDQLVQMVGGNDNA